MDHELQTNAIEQGVSCVIARRAIPSVCVYACVYVNRNEWTLHHLADDGKTFFLWQSCGRSVGDMCVESVDIQYVGCHSVRT